MAGRCSGNQVELMHALCELKCANSLDCKLNGYVYGNRGNNYTRALISQDYWGDIKEDWGSGDRSPPEGSRGGDPVGG